MKLGEFKKVIVIERGNSRGMRRERERRIVINTEPDGSEKVGLCAKSQTLNPLFL